MIRVGPGVVLLLFWLAWALPSFAQVLEKTHSFEGPPPPPEELMQAADGAFYGTTSSGGPFHAGTLFKMNSMGPVNRLAAFNGTNGVQPNSRLIQDLDGNFYGTTYTGGSNNLGTVFRMTPAKVLSALHTFSAGHGAHPTGLFLQASDGSFYGVTADGCGDTNAPAIFKLTKAGDFTIVAIMDPEGQGAPTSLS
ncbi:MAG: 3-carboxymuconate cyclase, partial [Verrucomicrobiales bacterium]|nr:3-carboxymuconate cyclase [Verrucomicrobiales bacterium]